ncbi:hypothetical protein HanPI659440_Chr09g0345771 [Helianthus annuus]|nr:hypothetical protein HanPI659440_Chr09g0345771 [Helianthus annuus]
MKCNSNSLHYKQKNLRSAIRNCNPIINNYDIYNLSKIVNKISKFCTFEIM